jgi:hypothetical protein
MAQQQWDVSGEKIVNAIIDSLCSSKARPLRIKSTVVNHRDALARTASLSR